MEIITNHRPRLIVDGYQLTEKEKRDFDYMEDIDGGAFVRYRGRLYDVGEFTRAPAALRLLGWEGIATDSFFSGVLIRFVSGDSDRVIMASCYS